MRHDTLRAICEQHLAPATAFWRSLIDAAVCREWVINVGLREAFSRLAHMSCELIYRLRSAGRIEGHVAEIPSGMKAAKKVLKLCICLQVKRGGMTGLESHCQVWCQASLASLRSRKRSPNRSSSQAAELPDPIPVSARPRRGCSTASRR
ncbi:hypothetical protein NKI51_28395 [Mesorhizobium australicum]|uniref:hypothetical protein n=1 Tax=Mesorhizobium australicum TaxID=536018 RepID=UPI0033384D06